jgi:hypothetical protein
MCEMSQLLFARPSFVEGMARIIDLGCTLTEFNRSPDGETADAIALASDWCAVGQDLRNAIDATNEQKEKMAHVAATKTHR